MPRRIEEVVRDVHCWALIKPNNTLVPSTVSVTIEDSWGRHFSESMWREKQKEGWRVVKVVLQLAPDNKQGMPKLRRRVTRR